MVLPDVEETVVVLVPFELFSKSFGISSRVGYLGTKLDKSHALPSTITRFGFVKHCCRNSSIAGIAGDGRPPFVYDLDALGGAGRLLLDDDEGLFELDDALVRRCGCS